MARAYAAKHGLELADVSFRDLGLSGFDRSNIERGALAEFLTAVKSGKVEPGSLLLIEQFDRLSRAEISVALRLLLDLVASDIGVVTLVDEKLWDKNTVNDMPNLMLSLILMFRAHEESLAKSQRLRAVWTEKKRTAGTKILTAECPRWLTLKADRSSFSVIEDRAEAIRQVFALSAAGIGANAIVRRANIEKWPVPGKGDSWHMSLINRLTRNRAVLGEYQPYSHLKQGGKRSRNPSGNPISDYYPAIIDPALFSTVQAVRERRPRFPGRRDVEYRNFLHGLVRCICGRTLFRKGGDKNYPDYARYYCSGRARGATDCPSIDSKELESTVLYAATALAGAYFSPSTKMAELKEQADSLTLAMSAGQRRIERLVEAIESTDTPPSALVSKLTLVEQEVREAEQRHAGILAQLAEMSKAGDPDERLGAAFALASGGAEERSELREILARLLAAVEADGRQHRVRIRFHGGDVWVNVPLNEKARLPGVVHTVAPP
ncbi:Resolvase domain protein (modular protein) [Acidithiobacillus ferrivorans]|nr:Resolvase domain protein (modular protein) [Acidithiobacillus ferrivorans]